MDAESLGDTSEEGVVIEVVGGRVEAISETLSPEKIDSESFSSAPPSAPKNRAKRGPPPEVGSEEESAPMEFTFLFPFC